MKLCIGDMGSTQSYVLPFPFCGNRGFFDAEEKEKLKAAVRDAEGGFVLLRVAKRVASGLWGMPTAPEALLQVVVEFHTASDAAEAPHDGSDGDLEGDVAEKLSHSIELQLGGALGRGD